MEKIQGWTYFTETDETLVFFKPFDGDREQVKQLVEECRHLEKANP